jgi:ubiquinone/menaquinone biosynthesis C-methylase UbiE
MFNEAYTFWDKFNSKYSKTWSSTLRIKLSESELNFINKYLPKSNKMKVLDIGFGAGRIIENFIKNKNCSVYAIDQSVKMYNFSKEKFSKNSNVNLKVCNISSEDIPFKEKFNLITAIRVLNYNNNWVDILGKMKKASSKNGVIIFTMPNQNSLSRFGKSDYTYIRTTYSELLEVCEKMGLKVLEVNTFLRLPNKYYDFSNNSIYVSIILLIEAFLYFIFGRTLFGKIFFVAAKVK